MLLLESQETINDYKQIIITQTYHQIAFFDYDIKKIEPFNTGVVTSYFVPECSQKDCCGGKCYKNPPNTMQVCLECIEWRKLEEILVDGFYAQRDGYIIYLQTGIRVPITKEFYKEITSMLNNKKNNPETYQF